VTLSPLALQPTVNDGFL